MGNFKKAIAFLNEKLGESNYLKAHPSEKAYRIEHSIRVANIGKEIAEKEGLNKEALIIACILHDVGYAKDFENDGSYVEHGRISAKIARPFLEELGFEATLINEICYGLAVHVDGKAGFEHEETVFALSVGDADNIDRFDAYRIYETLELKQFSKISLEEKNEYADKMTSFLKKVRNEKLASATATEIFSSKVDFQLDYYSRLKKQLAASSEILLP